MGLNLCLIWRPIIPPTEIIAHHLTNLSIFLALLLFMYAHMFHALFASLFGALFATLLTTTFFPYIS